MFVLGLAFFLAEHDLRKSSLEQFSLSEEEMVSAVETGAAHRQLAFLAIGGLGLCFLSRKTGQTLSFDHPLALLALAYVAWCLASLAWSTDFSITAKRLAVFVLCFLGVLGINRRLTDGDLCTLALVLTGVFTAIGLAAEMALGNFHPWLTEYRFGGTLHPNGQGIYCAIFCLAAVCKALGATRHKSLFVALAAAGAALLLLTKSRAALAALAVALPALWLVKTPAKKKLLVGIGAVGAAASLTLMASLLGVDVIGKMTDAVLLGRTEDTGSLSGRIPLWGELLGYADQRPLVGYGYDTFWTTPHIEEVSAVAEWAIHTGHSAYIDALLGVGLVGVGLLALVVAIAAFRAATRCAATANAGPGFIFGLLVFGLVNATMESGFVQPVFVPFLAACGVGRMAFCCEESTDRCRTST